MTGDGSYPTRGPGKTDGNTGGKFVTTSHALNSAIVKLSKLTPVSTVYRGASGIEHFSLYACHFSDNLSSKTCAHAPILRTVWLSARPMFWFFRPYLRAIHV